jgi:hypothetical protein
MLNFQFTTVIFRPVQSPDCAVLKARLPARFISLFRFIFLEFLSLQKSFYTGTGVPRGTTCIGFDPARALT